MTAFDTMKSDTLLSIIINLVFVAVEITADSEN